MVRNFFQTLGAGPSALVFTTSGTVGDFAINNNAGTSTVIFDDGSTQNFNGQVFKAYATGGRHYTVVKTAFASSIIYVGLQHVISTGNQADGVIELDHLTALTGLGITGASPIRKISGQVLGQVYLSGLPLQGQSLDLSELRGTEILANYVGCSSIVFPKANAITNSLNISGNQLSGPLSFAALTNLQSLFIGDSGGTGQAGNAYDITSVDLSLLSGLRVLHINACFTRTLIFGANALPLFTQLNAPACRFSARAEVGGNMASLIAFLDRARSITSITLSNGALTEQDITNLIGSLYASRAARPAVQLSLQGQAYNIRYPTISRGEAYNAPVVNRLTQQRIYELLFMGWDLGYNMPMMRLTKVTATTTRLTYEGLEDITSWEVGSYIINVDTNSAQVAKGRYLVTGGAGKVWDISCPNGDLATNWTGHLAVFKAPPFMPAGLLANGDFNSAGSWQSTGGWVQAAGELRGAGNTGFYYQAASNYTSPITAGQQYEVIFYLSSLAGGFKVVFNNGIEYNVTKAGYHTYVFTGVAGDTTINLVGFDYAGVQFNGACEWVQVRLKQ